MALGDEPPGSPTICRHESVGGASSVPTPTQLTADQQMDVVFWRLLDTLPPKVVASIAISSLAGALGCCCLAWAQPKIVTQDIQRFVFCLLIAFLFSMFVFVLYPVKGSLKFKNTEIPYVFVGPAALWMALLLVLMNTFPRLPANVFFRFKGDPLDMQTTWVLSWNASPKESLFVSATTEDLGDHQGNLVGMVIKPEDGVSTYSAVLGVGPSEVQIARRYNVTFNLGESFAEVLRVVEEPKK